MDEGTGASGSWSGCYLLAASSWYIGTSEWQQVRVPRVVGVGAVCLQLVLGT